MKTKVLGFVSGAIIAAIAVLGFSAWRHVSDEDRLRTALVDHCIPYILSGITPFDGLGRPAGVYDNVDRDARLTGGGTAIVFDDRFVASWGEIEDPPVRLCRVDGRSLDAATQGFTVSIDAFTSDVTAAAQALGDLRPDFERSSGDFDDGGLFRTLGWFEADKPRDRGNRIVMSVVQSQVTSLIVVRDTTP